MIRTFECRTCGRKNSTNRCTSCGCLCRQVSGPKVTRTAATNKRYAKISRPWTKAEDAYIQSHWLVPMVTQAAVLRRSPGEVTNRRQAMLGKVAMLMCDKERKPGEKTARAVEIGQEVRRAKSGRRKMIRGGR